MLYIKTLFTFQSHYNSPINFSAEEQPNRRSNKWNLFYHSKWAKVSQGLTKWWQLETFFSKKTTSCNNEIIKWINEFIAIRLIYKFSILLKWKASKYNMCIDLIKMTMVLKCQPMRKKVLRKIHHKYGFECYNLVYHLFQK